MLSVPGIHLKSDTMRCTGHIAYPSYLQQLCSLLNCAACSEAPHQAFKNRVMMLLSLLWQLSCMNVRI